MTTIVAPSSTRYSNVAELWHSLDDVPLERILMSPTPGTATEADLLRHVNGDDKRLVELIDGTLVEKTVGWLEALIATHLANVIAKHAREHHLGVVAGADATLRMSGGNIRLPDVVFVAFADMPGGKIPTVAVPKLAPTLAIEVISEGNTKAEMRRKLTEYFDSGTKLVWMVYPKTKMIAIFEHADETPARTLAESDLLDGGTVLPGFSIPVSEVFNIQA